MIDIYSKIKSVDFRKITIIILALIYWYFSMTEHLAFSDFVTSYQNTPWGKIVPRDYSLHAGLFFLFALMVYLIFNLFTGKRRSATLLYFLISLLAMVAAYRILIFEPVEIIHYLQYAILAFLLAYAMDKMMDRYLFGAILFVVTLLGVIDEINQYFYMTREYSKYLDWNDFLLNEIGASLGLLFFYGFRNMKPKIWSRREFVNSRKFKSILIFLTVLSLLFLIGIVELSPEIESESALVWNQNGLKVYLERSPGLYGIWKIGDRGWLVHILTPLNGSFLMILYGLIISTFQYNLSSIKGSFNNQIGNKP